MPRYIHEERDFELQECPTHPDAAMEAIETFLQKSVMEPRQLFIAPAIYRSLVGYTVEDNKIATLKRRYPGMEIICAYLQAGEDFEDIGLTGTIRVEE